MYRLSRRALLRLGGGGALGLTAASLLAACAPATPAAPGANQSAPTAGATQATPGPLSLPTYVPFQGPAPDFPPGADGVVPPGYLSFPKNLVKVSSGPVGKQGESVSFMTYSINPSPAPVDQNPAWQQVNRDLGLDLRFTYTALQDYNVKLNTVISSGQLPDTFTMNVLNVLIPNELEFFQSQCADLTPYLAGDAIKAYPNLANFPPLAWKNCVFNGKLYALPRVVNGVGLTMIVQQNLLDTLGVRQIKDKDDFASLCKQLTTSSTYAIGGTQATSMQWLLGVFRAPNNWRESGGKLTKDWETPEYQAAVAYLRGFWDAGYIHPDTPTYIQQQGAQSFYAGKFAMYPTDFFAFGIAWDRLLGINKNFKLSAIVPFGFDGGSGYQMQNPGINQITVVKKASPERVQQVLATLNYLASPFGSQEYLNLWYGVQGVDFNFNEAGNPVYTQTGQNNVQYIAWQTIISPPPVLFDPLGDPNEVKVAHPLMSASHALAITDPTLGLYSSTQAAKGAQLNQMMTDGINQILFGRADVSSLDQLVQRWRSQGGDQIRSEYEQALAAARA